MKLLIDTDPGVDDALAILMALADARAEVVALTTTAGNVGIRHTTRNALKLLDVAGANVPVYAGAAAPLLGESDDAAFVHGRDGFGDTGYLDPVRCAESEPAAAAMVRLARARPGELTLVMLGPLTNLALALALDPGLPQRVARLVIMGGAVNGRGNTARIAAEFNLGADPDAAARVFDLWPRFDLVDWEATVAHGVAFERVEGWLARASSPGRFYAAVARRTIDWMRGRRERWLGADPLAMAAVLEPDAATWIERRVFTERGGRHARGASVVDWERRTGLPANARLLERFPAARFEALLAAALT
jgi:purine nucleosidase